MTQEAAFDFYNFAPTCLRRDIGLLGFLHKRVLGECHPAVSQYFPLHPPSYGWHTKTIELFDGLIVTKRPLFQRSVFAMIHVYNRLPPDIVNLISVKSFQAELTKIAKQRCRNKYTDWPHSFHNEAEIWRWRIALDQRTAAS